MLLRVVAERGERHGVLAKHLADNALQCGPFPFGALVVVHASAANLRERALQRRDVVPALDVECFHLVPAAARVVEALLRMRPPAIALDDEEH
eukprot:7053095-Pyramimonas_sp.AAC.1